MNFEAIDRKGTYTSKLDDAINRFGTTDLLPLWVADMDLESPPCVQKRLKKRAEHPIYGYTEYPAQYRTIIKNWIEKRFDYSVDEEWIVPCYGVVPSMNFCIEAYTKEGDGIIIQTPIYPPFISYVKRRNRKLLDNTLLYKDGKYSIDFDDFEAKAKEAKMFLFCSPHNPSGRVWDKEELEKIIDICIENNVLIVSDEIHADIVYEKSHHIISTFEKIKDNCVVLNAPSKTFNIAGLNTSYAIIPNSKVRKEYIYSQDTGGTSCGTPFGIEALMSAYEDGEEWLEELKVHLKSNIDFVNTFILENRLPIHAVKTEGTFLIWLDCSSLGLSQEDLVKFFVYDAKLGLNDGVSFGDCGEGFMRLNVGTSKSVIEEAMNRLLNAYRNIV
ncbi:Cystathionine beta-lyase, Bsu PatB [hydrothermal vent metagenome]|uniref:cysteine-S-conjugate beta-lyase n=1 Tax=hydrothermal vent metagenome TaxID=652676 RepID=A0A1W1EFE0_9ZZZZ